MSYSVKIDGVEMLDYTLKNRILLEPKLEDELNEVGTFEFKMPPNHLYYTKPEPLNSTVEVYEDGSMIWYGRVLSVDTDYYREKDICCEGPLGWFKDSVQRAAEYEDMTITAFFRKIIETHNSMVASKRQFTVGTVAITSEAETRTLDYESTYDAIMNKCVDVYGGYLFFRRTNDTNYVDWLKEMPYSCNQPVEFGLNLTDIESHFDAGDIITGIIPLGATVQANDDPSKGEVIPEDDPRVGKPLTLQYTYGSDLLLNDAAVALYGQIIEAVTFSGVDDAAQLREEGMKYLANSPVEKLTFSCKAVEMADKNDSYDRFRLGQNVLCRSKPHALEETLPIIKMEIEMDTPIKEISLGTAPRQPISRLLQATKVVKGETELEIDFSNALIELTLDVSGSMNSTRMADMKTCSKELCSRLLSSGVGNQQIGIVSFGASTKTVCDFTNVTSDLEAAIDGLYASGGTPMAEAINLSRANLAAAGHAGLTKVIVLFSDGEPNSSSEAISAAETAKDERCLIMTMRLGATGTNTVMTEIATMPNWAFVSTDMDAMFEAVITLLGG